MPGALAEVIAGVRAEVVVVSFSNEGFLPLEALVELCAVRGNPVAVLAFDTRRYIGSQLGVFSPSGVRVGTAGPQRNLEYLLVSAPPHLLQRLTDQPASGVPARSVTSGTPPTVK
jgi:adenine-specific DNA-methyltransferase